MAKHKKGEETWENKAIRLSIKCTELEQALEESRGDTKRAEEWGEHLAAAVNQLKIELADMRKHRDRAVEQAGEAKMALRDKRIELARAMGWIDCKMDKPPQLDLQIPF